MVDRGTILDQLFINAQVHMSDLAAGDGTFSNLQILRKITQEQQQAYIDLLASFRDTPNRSPYNAAHQEIGRRIYRLARQCGYERCPERDCTGTDVFGNPTHEKFYRRKSD